MSENSLRTVKYQSRLWALPLTNTYLSYLKKKMWREDLIIIIILAWNLLTYTSIDSYFDSINQNIHFKKLLAIVFLLHATKWFKSSLSNRKFIVNIKNLYSSRQIFERRTTMFCLVALKVRNKANTRLCFLYIGITICTCTFFFVYFVILWCICL